MLRRAPRHRGDLRTLGLAQHGLGIHQLGFQRRAIRGDAIAVAIFLAAHQLVRQPLDRRDHHNAAIT